MFQALVPAFSDKPSGKWWKKADSTNIGSTYLVCGFNHLEKYESQWEGLSNHQPDIVSTVFSDAIACLHGFKISKG
jgi:hypothetical protein